MKRRMSSISAFYNFLHKKRIVKESPMDFITRPKKDTDILKQTYLTKDEVILMKQKLKEREDLMLETYALFSLSTMARVTAVANLKWKQIDFDERTCHDVLEKEGKLVDLFFNEEVKELLLKLKKYRIDNKIEDNGYVFVNKDTGKPMTTSTFDSWCKTIGEMIGEPTLHCHDFRHSGATLLKNAGMSLEDVSKLLNHASTDTTKKFYLKEDSSKIQANKDKFEI